jgi:hypothetical protein
MALYRHIPMSRIVNQLDILLPGTRPFVAPSAVMQARRRQGDELVKLTTSPRARKKWPTLPITLMARLITKQIKGKPVSILTSLLDAKRFPA